MTNQRELILVTILCCIAIGMLPFNDWIKAFIRWARRWRLALDIFRIRRNKWVAAVTFDSEPCGACLHRSSIHFITTEQWRDMTAAEIQTAWALVRIIEPNQIDTTKGLFRLYEQAALDKAWRNAIRLRRVPGLCFKPDWLPPEKHLSVVIHPDAGSAH